MQHCGFRARSAPGPRPIRAEGCAATRKVPEAAASRALWTRLLQVQVTPQKPLPPPNAPPLHFMTETDDNQSLLK